MTGATPYGDLGNTTDRLVAIGFNTMSTRNAGFATIDLNALSTATINTYSIMMFIGSGPGSTAGGIRTTTLFVVIIAI
jgi:Trk-type K+ transport system membrane component